MSLIGRAEHARLADALTAQGCTGGKMEWDDDDREFEVEDAICDGRKYELKFDAEFLFKSMKTSRAFHFGSAGGQTAFNSDDSS